MTETIKRTWKLLEDTVKQTNYKNPEIQLNNGSYDIYEQRFNYWYKNIKDKYMNNNVTYLDRHKVAAIVIISIIESHAIDCSKEISSEKKFIGQYLTAASVGITYMQDRLNYLLIKKREKPIEKIWMPEIVFSCNVPYFDIFCRNLYYADDEKDWGLNPLDISKELFLLEYITVEKQGIDPRILKEKTS